MQGAAAPAFFSLDLLSTLLEQTRSSAMNVSSQHERAHESQKGTGRVPRSEWATWAWPRASQGPPRFATLPLVAIPSPDGATKRSRPDSASLVPSLRIAAPARRNRPHLPWRNRVILFVQRTRFSLRRRAFLPRSAWTRKIASASKKQLRVGW